MMDDCRLVATWTSEAPGNGAVEFALYNLGRATLDIARIAYTSLTRTAADNRCAGVHLMRRIANFHEYAPNAPLSLGPGDVFRFTVEGLTRKPVHRNDGMAGVYLTLADGRIKTVASGDIVLKGIRPEVPPRLMPEGRVSVPAAVLPWPQRVDIASAFKAPPVALFVAEGASATALTALSRIEDLKARLFPAEAMVFALEPVMGGQPVVVEHVPDLAAESYRIAFARDGVRVAHADDAGLNYALISLAQLMVGARTAPQAFNFPQEGVIEDVPRYTWRGCHLDVSRQVYPVASISRFLDILAWNKLNVFHWHLADDEGWRIEIKALPQLTDIGARRGATEALLPQSGKGPDTEALHYTQDEVAVLISHAAALNIDVIPEVDIPGHSTAVLKALPHLVDPGEPPESYHSVQGYPNNALNPAIEATYDMLEIVLGEIAALFPSGYLHVGGDEVDERSWLASPLARDLMAREGLSGTAELQGYFLRRIKGIVTRLGKRMAGWDEVSHGGGVDPDGTLLMAWQKPELGHELARMGYEVVMTPGQAYYLDMVQDDAFLEPGTSWAGTVPSEKTYNFEAAGGFPPELEDKLRGVQACIWSEHLTSREMFNHMVFPRLSAVAEAGWTNPEAKDFQRFAVISRLMPLL